MRRSYPCALAATALLLFACGGTQKNAESADEYGHVDEASEGENEGSGDVEQQNVGDEQKNDEESSDGVKAPEFKEGMSVNDAINAVPMGTPREDIDPETLSIPLRDPALYQPCKLAASQHFTMKVAVWDGRAVGLDLETQPNNPTVDACIRQQLSQLVWRDKAKGLNVVEYSY